MINLATNQRIQSTLNFSEVIQLSCPLLPLTCVANVRRDENKRAWYFCLSFSDSLPFPLSLLSIMQANFASCPFFTGS